MDKPRPLILTGLSGAGLSSSLKHLEDMGYEVFDNFPLSLAGQLVNDPVGPGQPVAIGIDTRSRGFNPETLLAVVDQLNAHLIYLTADDPILQRRFTETRRRHPLAKDRPVSAGIQREKEWLFSLKNKAETVIDTSDLSVHDLRRVLDHVCRIEQTGALTVTLLSFAYRHGLPREADIVFDARFLRNPHWAPELRPLTGLDEAVRRHVAEDPDCEPFVNHLQALLEPLLARFVQEGKSYLTIAFGCTGGRHRSVTLVEWLKPWFERQNLNVSALHRDIDRA